MRGIVKGQMPPGFACLRADLPVPWGMSKLEDEATPPVIHPSLVTAPPRSRTGKYIFLIIIFLMAGIFILGGWFISSLGDLADSLTLPAGTRYEEVTVRAGDSDQRIAVIRVNGIISSYGSMGDSLVTQVKKQLDFAADDRRVKAVILRIDSPGGEVLASDEIARAIREFQEDTDKPVIASMGGLAASGGYYIAAPCEYIVANELTITGSIGVIMQSINMHGLMDKVGIQPITYKSGKNKNMLDPFSPPSETTDEQKQILQGFIDETYQRFVKVVEDGRAKKLAKDWRDSADGRILTGKQAFKLGMVDQLGNFDDAVKFAEGVVSIGKGNARLVRHNPPVNFGGLLRLLGQANEQNPGTTIKLDLGLDLPKLKAGVPYYLSLHLFAE
jgi:protease-4